MDISSIKFLIRDIDDFVRIKVLYQSLIVVNITALFNIVDIDTKGGCISNFLEHILALIQRLFGQFALGDVLHRAEELTRFTVSIPFKDGIAEIEPPIAAVR